MPKKSRKQTKKIKEIRKKLKIWAIVVGAIVVLTMIFSENSYINNDLMLVECKGIKVLGKCFGSEESVSNFSMPQP